MTTRLPYRYRTIAFAAVMSLCTSMIVSGILISLHPRPGKLFIDVWPSAFMTAWPVVFVAILVIAPLVNRLLDRIVEPS
ncbi:MAG TPA: DUF2798 domain-containing protein [Methylophilaceae bacterium]|nr:DUF2798 domain-containing protein [Methylophilaceae bacterium]